MKVIRHFLTFVSLCTLKWNQSHHCFVTATQDLFRTALLPQAEPQSRTLESRIIGGSIANATRYPYFTNLLIFLTSGELMTCGGSLIAPEIVLSAAHCFSGFVSPVTRISATVNATASHTSSIYQYKSNVVDYVLHPDFNASKSRTKHDVAVLKLGVSLNQVPLIKINKNPSKPIDDENVTSIGLGKNNTDLTSNPDFLLEVSIKTVAFAECASYYPSLAIVENIMVCAGGTEGPCGGDSGGPLTLIGTRPEDDIQVGITSFRRNKLCGLTNAPLGFTRVSYYANWIDEQVCRLSTQKPSTCGVSSSKPSSAPTLDNISLKPIMKPSARPTLRPTRKPTTTKPTLTPTTMKPTIMPTTIKPTMKPTSMKPTIKPTTMKPTIKPTSMKPTTKPTTMKPTTKPTTMKPTTKPTTMNPTIKPTTMRPTTTKPTFRPTTRKPTIKPTTRKPSIKPTTKKPS